MYFFFWPLCFLFFDVRVLTTPFVIFKHFLLMLWVVYLYLECNNGTFGDGCLFRCYCQSGFCDKISGTCPDKLCQPGWIGNSCSEGIWLRQFSTAPNEQHLSRDIVIWLLQGTIYINMSIILSFNCGNVWIQCSHFYLRHERRPWVYEPRLPFVRPDQRRCLLCVICKADIIRKYKCWLSTISSISLKRTTTSSFNNMQTLHHYYVTRIYISIKLLNLGF